MRIGSSCSGLQSFTNNNSNDCDYFETAADAELIIVAVENAFRGQVLGACSLEEV